MEFFMSLQPDGELILISFFQVEIQPQYHHLRGSGGSITSHMTRAGWVITSTILILPQAGCCLVSLLSSLRIIAFARDVEVTLSLSISSEKTEKLQEKFKQVSWSGEG